MTSTMTAIVHNMAAAAKPAAHSMSESADFVTAVQCACDPCS